MRWRAKGITPRRIDAVARERETFPGKTMRGKCGERYGSWNVGGAA